MSSQWAVIGPAVGPRFTRSTTTLYLERGPAQTCQMNEKSSLGAQDDHMDNLKMGLVKYLIIALHSNLFSLHTKPICRDIKH